MSKRPIETKQINKLRRALQRTPPRYINLVDYLLDRRLAKSRREARDMLADGKVRHESHVVGRQQETHVTPDGKEVKRWFSSPLVPASYRGKLLVA